MTKCYNCGKEIEGEPTLFITVKYKRPVCSDKCKRSVEGFLGMILSSDGLIDT